jgi:hypothetical protein
MNKVVPSYGSTFFGFGSARHNRAPKSLDPDFVRLDDRTLPELIAYAAELSKHIHYYNFDNKKDGSWEPFFYSDISVNIALIISVDLKQLDKKATNVINSFYSNQSIDSKAKDYISLFTICKNIVNNFNDWHASIVKLNLNQKKFESQVEFELFNIINDKVKPHLNELIQFKNIGEKIKPLQELDNFSFDNINEHWIDENHSSSNLFNGKNDLEKLISGMLALRLQYRFIFQALNFTVNHFKRYFHNSLKFKDNHNPDIALFISFLKVFRNVQNDYNKITERLQSFYYKNILKLEPYDGDSDFTYIFFEAADNIDRHLLPKGSLLSAGLNDDGSDILFETVDDLEITQAKIEKIQTVYSSRLDDLDTSNYKLTSHIYSAPVANSVDGLGKFQEIRHPWPIFGEEQEYKASEESNMGHANLGFAFSSPIFHLNEGNRKVTIRLDFSKESTRIYKRLVYDIYLKVNKERKANEPAKVLQEIFYDRIFNQVDKERNFRIFLTSSMKWHEVQANTITFKAVGNGDWVFDTELPDEENMNVLNALEIEFTLPNSVPPIVSYNPSIHEGDIFDTPDPLIKLVLNDKKQPLVYSFFQSLSVEKINVKVDVDRLRMIKAYDEQGSYYEGRNIYPYGIQPQRGSLSYIGAPELFKKDLTEAVLHVEWDKVPETVEDFLEHYKGYQEPLHPAEIKVQFGVISNFDHQLPGDEALEFPMFTTTEGDQEIIPITPLDHSKYVLDEDKLALLDIIPNYDLPSDNPYEDNMETGYFIMQIVEPRHALYNNIYQNELQQAINKNIENPEEQKNFPEVPVIPFYKNAYFSYKAETEWNILHGDTSKPEMNFHIHPYGVETIFEGGTSSKDYLLPEYNKDGYLFIGLKDVSPPETITLFFELTSEETTDQTIKNVPNITWMYLSENRWIPFDDSKLIFDTTYGFTETGNVRLQLPLTITDGNTILDENLFWIGASINGDVSKICKAIHLTTNGVLAKWIFDHDNKDRLYDTLPSGTISSLQTDIPQIKSVSQPYPSFGARLPENTAQFNIRVSEKLRHKERAVTHWDIERIILEKFPTVQQTKVLSYLSDPIDLDSDEQKEYVFADDEAREEKYGIEHLKGVKIVVAPHRKLDEVTMTPKFSLHRLLLIEKYITERISPFMSAQVINPKYEHVRVIANVKFIANYNNGQTLNRLFNDINNFIAPWLYSSTEEMKIGGSINENVLQTYIKGLDYVKFLTKFSILHIIEDDGVYKLQDTAMEEDIVSIIAARPWGLLIPDDIHEIEMVEYEEEEAPIPRVNSDNIIRFQNKVNILGDKKYIKVKNSQLSENDAKSISKKNPTSNFSINI